ncbi:MAG: hypothetical protein ACR2MA_10195 [Egibacteraceae bacterium]
MEEPTAADAPADSNAPVEYRGLDRRAPEPLLYTSDQLVGRAPLRLRRRSDKIRLAAHLVAAAALIGLTAWWVLPLHAFAGPVLMTFAPGRGVHAGDLPSLMFVALALRSCWVAGRIVRTTAAVRGSTAA